MKKRAVFIVKLFALFVICGVVFGLGHKFIGELGRMPMAFVKAYETSSIVKNGLALPAAIILLLLNLSQIFISFWLIEKRIPSNRRYMKGLLFGVFVAGFAILQFLQFTIMNHDDLLTEIQSGLRDAFSWIVFGLLVGFWFGTKKTISEPRKKIDLLAVPFVAVGFAIFHGLQYYVTAPELNQSIENVAQVLWLLITGAWVGFAYFLLKPRLKNSNPILGVLFFSVFIIGLDNFLFNLFGNIWVDLPVGGLLALCLFDSFGIAAGLIGHELLVKRIQKRTQARSAGQTELIGKVIARHSP